MGAFVSADVANRRIVMRLNPHRNAIIASATMIAIGAGAIAAAPMGTGFTYQGQLKAQGIPLDGAVDLRFSLFDVDSGGLPLDELDVADVAVSSGLFTVALDFGAVVFDGEARWLEVAVRSPHDPTDIEPFMTLSPRQPLTATPYALQTRGLFVDETGNVGIGTNSPLYPLHIATDANRAVHAEATGVSGTKYGVFAQSLTSEGIGVCGWASALAGVNIGVKGIGSSPDGTGVLGFAPRESGTNYAVRGTTMSSRGYAGYFEGGRNYFEGDVGMGTASPAYPLHVETSSSHRAVFVKNSRDSIFETYGIYAEADDDQSRAVAGYATADEGDTVGVYGLSSSPTGRGVYGVASVTNGINYGVYGHSISTEGCGVLGYHGINSGPGIGVKGKTASPDGYAGYFEGPRNYFEGRVGMGTTSPTSQLHVNSPSDVDPLRVQLNGSTKFAVKRNGYTAVGSNNLPSYQLEVFGDGTAGKPGGGSWSNSSDRRLKKNIRAIPDALDHLLALRGVRFEYKDPEAINELPGTRTGMVAQEVETVEPDWVDVGPEGFKRVTYRGFEALAVEALRELRAEKDAQIEALRKENAAMRRRLAELERRLEAGKDRAD
jgi:hypothetical protein